MNESSAEPIFSSEPSTEALFLGFSFAEQISWLAEREAHAHAQLAGGVLERIPEPHRTVLLVVAAQGLIMNGNIQRFFENDWPEQPPYSIFVNAYRAIGAVEPADCLEDAVAQFDFPEPERDYQARRRLMDSVDQQGRPTHANQVIDRLGCRMIDLGMLVAECMAGFVERHLAAFPSAARHFERRAKGEIPPAAKSENA